MDLFGTFYKLLLDLRDGHVYNVFQRCAVAYAQNSMDPQRSVPDKLARIRAKRTRSRQEKDQRLVRQRPPQQV